VVGLTGFPPPSFRLPCGQVRFVVVGNIVGAREDIRAKRTDASSLPSDRTGRLVSEYLKCQHLDAVSGD